MNSAAVISDCGLYRYFLMRGEQNALPFLMLNPSTADGQLDDPTIRRCKGFANTVGYDGIVVMNLYAYRATKPEDLWTVSDPVGPENDAWIAKLARYPEVVCAWGSNAKQDRIQQVIEILKSSGVGIKCLGTTKHGAPRHPLYVKASQPLIDWEMK